MYRVIEREADQIKRMTERDYAIEATTEAIHWMRDARKQSRHVTIEVQKGNDVFGFYTVYTYQR